MGGGHYEYYHFLSQEISRIFGLLPYMGLVMLVKKRSSETTETTQYPSFSEEPEIYLKSYMVEEKNIEIPKRKSKKSDDVEFIF